MSNYDAVAVSMRDYPQVYVNRARIRAALGEYDPAVADIKHAIKLLTRAGYYYELGCVCYVAGRYGEARSAAT